MIDTHAHLDFENFESDLKNVVSDFLKDNQEGRIVNIGVDFERNLKSVELAQKYRIIFSTIGFHPEVLDEMGGEFDLQKALSQLEDLAHKEKVVAIGEIGLDYFHNKENKEEQKKLFIAQLDFALKKNLPVVIHCRDAYEDAYKIISQKKYENLMMVMHCFCANLKQTKIFLELENLFFSFTGNITFPKKDDAEIFDVIKTIPLDRMMVETDCPFLAPHPFRGKRNEPKFVKYVIEKMALLKKEDFREIEKTFDKNAINFFNLK